MPLLLFLNFSSSFYFICKVYILFILTFSKRWIKIAYVFKLQKKIKDQMVAQKSMEMNQENITKSVDEKCDNENTQAKIEENRKESKEECFEIKNTKEQEVIIRKKGRWLVMYEGASIYYR